MRGAASLPNATGEIVAADEPDSTKDELPERRSRTMTKMGEVIETGYPEGEERED